MTDLLYQVVSDLGLIVLFIFYSIDYFIINIKLNITLKKSYFYSAVRHNFIDQKLPRALE